MRVKQPVARNTQRLPQIHPAAEMSDKAGVGSAHGESKMNIQDKPGQQNPKTDDYSKTDEDPKNDEDAHLLSADKVDLAFEREEMVQSESADKNVTSDPKVWQIKGLNLKLSALEAAIAVKAGVFTYDDFEIYAAPSSAPVDEGPADPLSGGLSAVLGAVGTVAQRVGDYPLLLAKVLDAKEGGQAEHEIVAFAKDSGKGVTGIGGAVLKAPMDITYNMSRGFKNLPKMYGDETVRPLEKVTDVQSGLQAAGKSFGFGLWDGVSGLVTQPMKGAQEGGWMGGLVGLGKGVGGAVFKPAAGVLGIPGYAFKGIYEEVRGPPVAANHKDLIEAQMIQGFKEWEAATAEDIRRILVQIKRQIEDLETLDG